MLDMCRAACRLAARLRHVLWRLRVLDMSPAACRMSARLSSMLFFSTASNTHERKATNQNEKYSHVWGSCLFCAPQGNYKIIPTVANCARIADSSAINVVSFSPARTAKRFPCRDARQQSRLFGLRDPPPKHRPNSIRLCWDCQR